MASSEQSGRCPRRSARRAHHHHLPALELRERLEDDQVEESVLVERLKEIRERAPAKSLVLLADSRLDVADVKRAMRASDRAGFHEFGCVVQKAVAKEPGR